MIRRAVATSAALLASILCLEPAGAQPSGRIGEYSDATIQGTVLEPRKSTMDGETGASTLRAPEGFRVELFAENLINPRMLAVSRAGKLHATRRSVGDVVHIEDTDQDGRADAVRTVASRPGMHGIAFDDDKVFLATVNDVYTAGVEEDGSFGPLQRIINDLPDGGQHPNRTLGIGPDGMLYISVGSTCNACAETNPESATILRAKPDGSTRSIFARGLRNTIGFDWEPTTGDLYGLDHGIDWLGDTEQVEELNLIRQGLQYGWPYIYGDDQPNPQDNSPEGVSLEDWARASEVPVLGYTAHSAPMQAVFYNGNAFPSDYRGDMFVAMRGSWNRRPPAGYEVVRVNFENGRPIGFEKFLEGFLTRADDGSYSYLGRLAGIAVGPDGSMFVADDSNGRIYRVRYQGPAPEPIASAPKPPVNVAKPLPSELAIQLVGPKAPGLTLDASFEDGEPTKTEQAADGDNASPAVKWGTLPPGTKSLAILFDDPDAAEPKPFVHWLVYDIPGQVKSLREGLPTDLVLPDPKGAKQGLNSSGSTGYSGPKPPVGDPPHHYLQLFALDVDTLGLDPGATRADVLKAMPGHVLAAGEQVVTYERK